MKRAVLLAWWFIALGGSTGIFGPDKATIGPFATFGDCEEMREWVTTASQYRTQKNTSRCWWDGKP